MIKIRISKQSSKFLSKLNKSNPKAAKSITRRIFLIREQGVTNNCKAMKNTNPPLYRSRCGNYRIIYMIKEELKIYVIGHCSDVYSKNLSYELENFDN